MLKHTYYGAPTEPLRSLRLVYRSVSVSVPTWRLVYRPGGAAGVPTSVGTLKCTDLRSTPKCTDSKSSEFGTLAAAKPKRSYIKLGVCTFGTLTAGVLKKQENTAWCIFIRYTYRRCIEKTWKYSLVYFHSVHLPSVYWKNMKIQLGVFSFGTLTVGVLKRHENTAWCIFIRYTCRRCIEKTWKYILVYFHFGTLTVGLLTGWRYLLKIPFAGERYGERILPHKESLTRCKKWAQKKWLKMRLFSPSPPFLHFPGKS